jgi:apolipoprotein N-acyltransferase
VATHANAYFIVGGLGTTGTLGSARPESLYNSAALLTPNGEWLARYDKVHLVPFGEYVPYKSILFFAEKITREVGDFSRGSARTVFKLPFYNVGTFICYESVFPNEIRQFAANGANVLVNISNDGWFGNTAAPEQHLNQARMRAIENNRWILRATNTGITAAIDPYGRVVARVPRNIRTALQAPYGVVQGATFYTRQGDWFAYACAIISIAVLVTRTGVRMRQVRQ